MSWTNEWLVDELMQMFLSGVFAQFWNPGRIKIIRILEIMKDETWRIPVKL